MFLTALIICAARSTCKRYLKTWMRITCDNFVTWNIWILDPYLTSRESIFVNFQPQNAFTVDDLWLKSYLVLVNCSWISWNYWCVTAEITFGLNQCNYKNINPHKKTTKKEIIYKKYITLSLFRFIPRRC